MNCFFLYCNLQDKPFPYLKAGEQITLSFLNKVGVLKKHSLFILFPTFFFICWYPISPKGPIYSDFVNVFDKKTSQRPSHIKFFDFKLETHNG